MLGKTLRENNSTLIFQYSQYDERSEETHEIRSSEGTTNLHNLLEAAEKSSHSLATYDIESQTADQKTKALSMRKL